MKSIPTQKDMMPESNNSESASRLSFKMSLFFIGLIAIAIVSMFFININSEKVLNENFRQILIGDTELHVGIADSPKERTQGLSGRLNLSLDEGLLFVFDEPDFQMFWMKDMNFAIDIIWIDKDKKVIHIEESVLPDTFPSTFTSKTPALYVLEVPAGLSKEKNIKFGDMLSFK